MKKFMYGLTCLLAAACSQPDPAKPIQKADASARVATVSTPSPDLKVPLYRTAVQPEPVDQYRERTDNPLNDWYFSVKLFETPKTFCYLMKLQYEEVEGEDTLKLPNFGMLPKPVIKKGPEKYSCIVGFMDNEDKFREYKKVYVQKDHLKVTALRHYAVATYEK